MAYTAVEFDWALAELGNYLRLSEGDGKHRRMAAIVNAALPIAAAVTRPGVIEEALEQLGEDHEKWNREAAAIRKAVGATDD